MKGKNRTSTAAIVTWDHIIEKKNLTLKPGQENITLWIDISGQSVFGWALLLLRHWLWILFEMKLNWGIRSVDTECFGKYQSVKSCCCIGTNHLSWRHLDPNYSVLSLNYVCLRSLILELKLTTDTTNVSLINKHLCRFSLHRDNMAVKTENCWIL